MNDKPNLGAASNTAVPLCRAVANNLHYVVYFDNYYTSPPLISFLTAKGIFALSTVKISKISNCKLSGDKTKMEDREIYCECLQF
ncbi:hypothetical protein NQ314_003333 [Rhamnusium bicolor]|uniref:PiggyBac transposable element-derived protein domain-containing protein n=1 Tax=Rhamnusium bicolor TaxID=1586634 RepID=A0AAV8ZNX6_9CUCU|nr:hypothetical protein NQ314_003333 [Rhamnusium bicolor]